MRGARWVRCCPMREGSNKLLDGGGLLSLGGLLEEITNSVLNRVVMSDQSLLALIKGAVAVTLPQDTRDSVGEVHKLLVVAHSSRGHRCRPCLDAGLSSAACLSRLERGGPNVPARGLLIIRAVVDADDLLLFVIVIAGDVGHGSLERVSGWRWHWSSVDGPGRGHRRS